MAVLVFGTICGAPAKFELCLRNHDTRDGSKFEYNYLQISRIDGEINLANICGLTRLNICFSDFFITSIHRAQILNTCDVFTMYYTHFNYTFYADHLFLWTKWCTLNAFQ